MTDRLRVVLVDDHTIVREGLRALLHGREGIEIVGEAANALDAFELIAKLMPDVVVLDLTLPGLGGIEATERILAQWPQTRVLVLSMHDGEDFVRPAIRAGASGYVVKGSGLADLVTAIRAVASGQAFFSPAAARVLLADATGRPPAKERMPALSALTTREQQILQRVAEGQTSLVIATELGISAKTVEGHRAHIMTKLGLHDVPALVRFAVRTGLVSLDR